MSRYHVETESGVYEVETNSFHDWEASPRVQVKLTDEIRALIHQQVAFGISEALRTMKPTVETKIIKETVNNPTKIVVQELVDNTSEIMKKVEAKIQAEINSLDKSGRFGPIVVPSPIADQTGNGGKVLSTDGRLTKWITAASGGGGGSSTDAYTASNVTTDRSYDATNTSLDELANVLGSLITSLQGAGIIQ